MNGLNIDIKGFEKLAGKQKLTILYQNTEELKHMIKGYKYEVKIHRFLIISMLIIIGAGKFVGLI